MHTKGLLDISKSPFLAKDNFIFVTINRPNPTFYFSNQIKFSTFNIETKINCIMNSNRRDFIKQAGMGILGA